MLISKYVRQYMFYLYQIDNMDIKIFIVVLWFISIIISVIVSTIINNKCNPLLKKKAEHFDNIDILHKESLSPYNNSYENGLVSPTVKTTDFIIDKSFTSNADLKFGNAKGNTISSEGKLTIASDDISFSDSKLSNIKIGSISLLDIMYPVGCIFTTTNQKFRPSTIFGGTWINIAEEKNFDNKGRTANGYRFLVATASNTGLQVGGSSYIGASNLPSHYHGIDITTASSDATHKHPIKSEFDNYDYNTVAHDRNFNKFIDELLKSNINSIPLDTSAKYYNHNKRYYRTTYTEDNKAPHTHKVTGNTKNSGNGVAWWPPYYRVYYWKRTA